MLPNQFLPVTNMNSPNPNGGGMQFPSMPMTPPPQSSGGGGMGGLASGMGGLLPMLLAGQGGGMGGMGGGAAAGLGGMAAGMGGDSGLLGLLGMNKPPSATVNLPGIGNGPATPTTISGAMPDLGAQGGGLHGLYHSLMGMFGG